MTVVKLRKEYFSFLLVAACFFVLFQFPIAIKNGVIKGIEICLYTIVPSLFPFMVLSTYIIKSDVLSPFYRFFYLPIKIMFRQPPCVTPVIVMSMIGGFPIGIKMTNDLYINRKITKEQAQRLCLFCINGGPAFVITTVGVSMLNSIQAGIIIYISLCISSLISGVISSFIASHDIPISNDKTNITLPIATLSSSVSDSLQSILNISAWVILFSSVTSFMSNLNLNEAVYITTSSILEVTNGCILLSGKVPLPIIAGIISFGGFCVHFQLLSYLKNIEMKYPYFFVGRFLNGIISSIITRISLMLFPIEIDVFSDFDKISVKSFSVSAPAFFVLLIMCIIMILDIDRTKKLC